MKRVFDKRMLQNKWVVPLSAMILTLCVGSFALASTAAHESRYSFIPPADASTTSLTQPESTTTSTSLPTLPMQTAETANQAAPMTADELAIQQAKENAILDLIREKMTAEDQATFDQLRAVAAEQQAALSKAQSDLQATKAGISALIDKYLGVPNGVSVDLVSGTTLAFPHPHSAPDK
jgi:hypothetical protein